MISFTLMKKFVETHASITASKYLLVMILIVLGTFFLGSALSAIFINSLGVQKDLTKNELFVANMLPFLVGFIILFFAIQKILNQKFSFVVTSRLKIDFKRILIGFGSWFLVLLVLFLITLAGSDHNIQWNFDSNKFWKLVPICLLFTPIQTGMEEFIFRGLLIKLFGKIMSKGVFIIVVTGLLFGAIHLGNPEIIQMGWIAVSFYVISGFFTSFITIMDDGLELSWGFHIANNIYGILILTNDWQVLQTDALFLDTSKPGMGWEIIAIMVLFYPLLLVIFSKVYRWSHWKERLFSSLTKTDK